MAISMTLFQYMPASSVTLLKIIFVKAPSFEAREAHWYQNDWLGIFRTRGGVCQTPVYPMPPTISSAYGGASGGQLTNYLHQMSNCGHCIIFPCCCIVLLQMFRSIVQSGFIFQFPQKVCYIFCGMSFGWLSSLDRAEQGSSKLHACINLLTSKPKIKLTQRVQTHIFFHFLQSHFQHQYHHSHVS